jgi:uncharacterized protein (DUF427 family)
MTSAHRITVTDVPGTVRVKVGGVVVAESTQARVLHEGSLPPRYYFPREHVRTDLLVGTDTSTNCPYKGDASYWTLEVGGEQHSDLVWSYADPIPEMVAITGLMCFYNDRVEIVLDEVAGTVTAR